MEHLVFHEARVCAPNDSALRSKCHKCPTFMLKIDSAKPPKIDRALGNNSFPASAPTRNPATYSTCTARFREALSLVVLILSKYNSLVPVDA